MHATPCPALSPAISETPISSPSPYTAVEESLYRKALIQQWKVLDMMLFSQIEETEFMKQMSSQGSAPSERSIEEQLWRANDKLQQHLLQQQIDHHREIMEMQEKHMADLKDLRDEHKKEMKKMHEQHIQQIIEIFQQKR